MIDTGVAVYMGLWFIYTLHCDDHRSTVCVIKHRVHAEAEEKWPTSA